MIWIEMLSLFLSMVSGYINVYNQFHALCSLLILVVKPPPENDTANQF